MITDGSLPAANRGCATLIEGRDHQVKRMVAAVSTTKADPANPTWNNLGTQYYSDLVTATGSTQTSARRRCG